MRVCVMYGGVYDGMADLWVNRQLFFFFFAVLPSLACFILFICFLSLLAPSLDIYLW